ncbi:hypothetical protein EZV73_04790 [Acidaminobacter sp. JC074]|uniref:hypothetical protein n=1 Tax=Acidaminobacter sp. JC074 TaxID=2530199 RepID=UPI001F10D38B|nr:hypothetical protein [Acidaminobacter sp. JC074]MCH4886871.1 hypothetical protein [Acidaminobacter sp. JC074]
MSIDKSRLIIHKKTKFKPFEVSSFVTAKQLIGDGILSGQEGVLVFEHHNTFYGLMTKQMTYHHVANGKLDNESFMISF